MFLTGARWRFLSKRKPFFLAFLRSNHGKSSNLTQFLPRNGVGHLQVIPCKQDANMITVEVERQALSA